MPPMLLTARFTACIPSVSSRSRSRRSSSLAWRQCSTGLFELHSWARTGACWEATTTGVFRDRISWVGGGRCISAGFDLAFLGQFWSRQTNRCYWLSCLGILYCPRLSVAVDTSYRPHIRRRSPCTVAFVHYPSTSRWEFARRYLQNEDCVVYLIIDEFDFAVGSWARAWTEG